MSASSSSASLVRRRAVADVAPGIPLVPCPDCGRLVKVYVSGTAEHSGWTFYKCKHHRSTCNFWHWEREYVYYLCETNVLQGNAAVDAVGWAEDRRDELEAELGKKKLAEWGKGTGASSSKPRNDDILVRGVNDLLVLGREILLLLKIGVAMVCFIAVVSMYLVVKK